MMSSIDFPTSLFTHLDTKNLDSVLRETRAAVSTNAQVLDKFCSRVDDLERRLVSIEDTTVKEMETVRRRAEQASKLMEEALQETQKLALQCVTRDEFRREQEKWETRVARLEDVNRELLAGSASASVMAAQQDPTTASAIAAATATEVSLSSSLTSYGPLGSFVAQVISAETRKPLQLLYDKVTQEWDAAFNTLSDEAFREIHECQSDLRTSEQRSLRCIEESKRQSIQLTRETSTDAAYMLQRAVDFLARHNTAAIEEAGFALRHEVTSMLFQAKKQIALLQRAITRLRNTLCLGPDSETVELIGPGDGVGVSFGGGNASSSVATLVASPPPVPRSAAARLKPPQVESTQVDFGQHRPKRTKTGKRHYRRRHHSSSSSSSSSSSETSSPSASENGEDDDEQEEIAPNDDDANDTLQDNSSLLIPSQFLSQPKNKDKKNNEDEANRRKKKQKEHNHDRKHRRHHSHRHHHPSHQLYGYPQGNVIASPVDALFAAAAASATTGATGSTFNSNNDSSSWYRFQQQLQLQQQQQQHSEVDIRNILNTPIFTALRNLIEESARNEIDAHNTLRETRFTTEIEDLRQAVMRKVNLETVHRLIEKGRDRRAQEQLEFCIKSIEELRRSVLKENEWRFLLKSKADFSEVDSVRVDCSKRIQMLEDVVQRTERAVIVGFGESLNVAPPKTFERLERVRLEDEAEQRRLFLERGSIDDTLIVAHENSMTNGTKAKKQGTSLEKDLFAAAASQSSERVQVDDARSVVVLSRRELLHSAPPSRPGGPSHITTASLAGNSTNSGSAGDADTIGDVNNNYRPHSATATLLHASPTRDPPIHHQQRVVTIMSSTPSAASIETTPQQQQRQRVRPQTALSTTSSLSSAAAAASSTMVITSRYPATAQQQQAPRPPRHDLIYSPSSSTSNSAVPPTTAPLRKKASGTNKNSDAATVTNKMSTQFSHALKNRCQLDDDAVQKW